MANYVFVVKKYSRKKRSDDKVQYPNKQDFIKNYKNLYKEFEKFYKLASKVCILLKTADIEDYVPVIRNIDGLIRNYTSAIKPDLLSIIDSLDYVVPNSGECNSLKWYYKSEKDVVKRRMEVLYYNLGMTPIGEYVKNYTDKFSQEIPSVIKVNSSLSKEKAIKYIKAIEKGVSPKGHSEKLGIYKQELADRAEKDREEKEAKKLLKWAELDQYLNNFSRRIFNTWQYGLSDKSIGFSSRSFYNRLKNELKNNQNVYIILCVNWYGDEVVYRYLTNGELTKTASTCGFYTKDEAINEIANLKSKGENVYKCCPFEVGQLVRG